MKVIEKTRWEGGKAVGIKKIRSIMKKRMDKMKRA